PPPSTCPAFSQAVGAQGATPAGTAGRCRHNRRMSGAIATGAPGPAVAVDAGWTLAPIVLVALVSYVAIYASRWRTSRREGGARAASKWRRAAWCAGVFALFVALISPVDRLGEQLASFHMVQHLLIADI